MIHGDLPSTTRKQAFSWFPIFPLLLYIILGFLVLGPIVIHPYTMFIGGPGDPQQFMWYLGWFWHAVSHGENPFHTTLINAPTGQNLMWNTSILAESLLFGPLTWLFNATFTYNLLWLINFVLSCFLGEKILRKLGIRTKLALFGGLLMGMLPYTTAQSLFHIHLWTTSVILAMLYLLIAGYISGIRRPVGFGLVFGLLTAFEFYTSIEVFATMALVTALLLVFVVIVSPRKLIAGVTWPRVLAMCVAGLVVAVLAAPGVYEMFVGANRPPGALLPTGVYVNDLLNFFLPTLVYLVHTPKTNAISAHYTGNFWENNGYLGFPAILLFLYAMKRLWHFPAARVCVYTSVFIILLSMGPVLHINGHLTGIRMPWLMFQRVPLIDSALPSRLMFFADILIVILLLSAVEDLFRKRAPRAKSRKIMVVLLVLVMVTWLPRMPYPHTVTPTAAKALSPQSPVYTEVLGQVTYVLTLGTSETMQAIAEAGYPFAMVNPYGYTSNQWPRAHALVLMGNVLKPGLSENQVKNLLLQGLPKLHAGRLLYFPLKPGERLSVLQYKALTSVLGPPIAQDEGMIVWDVSSSGGRSSS